MEKAKVILSGIAIVAVIAGALAFKANRLPRNVYTLLPGNKPTAIVVRGFIYTTTIPNCALVDLATTNVGSPVNVSSTTTSPLSVTAFKSAGHADFITTFAYCTLWVTRVEIAD